MILKCLSFLRSSFSSKNYTYVFEYQFLVTLPFSGNFIFLKILLTVEKKGRYSY